MADRLSCDAAAARAAGMQYGQWKAMHPHTEYEDAPIGEGQQCKHCGKWFPKRGHHRIYCSKACAYEAEKIKNREYAQRKKAMAAGIEM